MQKLNDLRYISDKNDKNYFQGSHWGPNRNNNTAKISEVCKGLRY